jgi:uncharacterized protein (TIGR03086 family)
MKGHAECNSRRALRQRDGHYSAVHGRRAREPVARSNAEHRMGKTIAEVANKFDGDVAGSDPAASYRASVSVATAAVTAPGAMEAVCHLSFGDFSGADYSAQLFLDLLIHGWDIARATEQDTRLPPELVEACIPIAQEITAMARSSGVYGDDLQVSPDADQQTRLLALVGRRA